MYFADVAAGASDDVRAALVAERLTFVDPVGKSVELSSIEVFFLATPERPIELKPEEKAIRIKPVGTATKAANWLEPGTRALQLFKRFDAQFWGLEPAVASIERMITVCGVDPTIAVLLCSCQPRLAMPLFSKFRIDTSLRLSDPLLKLYYDSGPIWGTRHDKLFITLAIRWANAHPTLAFYEQCFRAGLDPNIDNLWMEFVSGGDKLPLLRLMIEEGADVYDMIDDLRAVLVQSQSGSFGVRWTDLQRDKLTNLTQIVDELMAIRAWLEFELSGLTGFSSPLVALTCSFLGWFETMKRRDTQITSNSRATFRPDSPVDPPDEHIEEPAFSFEEAAQIDIKALELDDSPQSGLASCM